MSFLPLFPLPNVVLFPGALLPLHIFEPRYRAMVADALGGDRRIGMVLLRPGWDRDYEGRPPVYDIGCSGVMIHATRLVDGRYNIVLRGLERFRVIAEEHDRPYRRATVLPLPDASGDDAERAALGDLRRRLASIIGAPLDASGEGDTAQAVQLAALPDADFIHTVCQHLDLEPIEKQALLARDSLLQRAGALIELVRMKRLAAALPPGAGWEH